MSKHKEEEREGVGRGEGRWKEYDNLKSETPATFSSALVGVRTVRKYLIQFDV